MKVVSILGGLGSQMYKYAFYLMLCKESYQDCYIDTTYFMQKKIWNGYELEKIFNIHAPDMKDVLPRDAINRINQKETNYITENIRFLLSSGTTCYWFLGEPHVYKSYSILHDAFRIVNHKLLNLKLLFGVQNRYPSDCFSENCNSYFDEYLMNSDEFFKSVKEEVIKTFCFPKFTDQKNIVTSNHMKMGDSVAIHIRRTDHLGDNGKLYKRQYYAKSVQFIKDKTKRELHYYIFSDDIEWCKANLHELGLNIKDDVIFVDWNNGASSFRDMQLMTYCQHNVLAISSFSWWGYYLSTMENKIVCAPEGYWLEVPNHF